MGIFTTSLQFFCLYRIYNLIDESQWLFISSFLQSLETASMYQFVATRRSCHNSSWYIANSCWLSMDDNQTPKIHEARFTEFTSKQNNVTYKKRINRGIHLQFANANKHIGLYIVVFSFGFKYIVLLQQKHPLFRFQPAAFSGSDRSLAVQSAALVKHYEKPPNKYKSTLQGVVFKP